MPAIRRNQTQVSAAPAAVAPKPATFDPLDAPLFEAYDFYISLADSVRAAHYQRWYWADPMNWTRHAPPDWVFNLQWKEYRYSEVDSPKKLRQHITEDKPGVYFFTVKPNRLLDQKFPQYVFYVGISNEGDSNRPLRERLFDYLPNSISAIKLRKTVHKFLALYYGQAWVCFAHVTNASSELEAAEMKLHGYLAPPVASRDYPPDMKHSKPAF